MQTFETDPAKGVEGRYVLRADISGSGRFEVAPGDSVVSIGVQAYRKGENPRRPDVAAELPVPRLLRSDIGHSLVLETPDSALNTAFQFSKTGLP